MMRVVSLLSIVVACVALVVIFATPTDAQIEGLNIGNLFGAPSRDKPLCGTGLKPVPKEGHEPHSNGCGSYGMQVDTSQLPGFEECCDVHGKNLSIL